MFACCEAVLFVLLLAPKDAEKTMLFLGQLTGGGVHAGDLKLRQKPCAD